MLIIFGDKVSETRGNTCGLLIKDGQRVDSEQIWSVSVSLSVSFIVFFHKLYRFSTLLREVKLPIPPTLVGLINNCWKWSYKGFSSPSRFYHSLCLYIHHVILSSGFQLSQIQRWLFFLQVGRESRCLHLFDAEIRILFSRSMSKRRQNGWINKGAQTCVTAEQQDEVSRPAGSWFKINTNWPQKFVIRSTRELVALGVNERRWHHFLWLRLN